MIEMGECGFLFVQDSFLTHHFSRARTQGTEGVPVKFFFFLLGFDLIEVGED